MAARFWVGGTGNWDAADTTHWAATSGGAGGQSVPTASDDVTFDTLSNATAYTCTVTATANCLNLTIGNPLSGAITFAGSSSMGVSGNLSLATSMTLTYTGNMTFNATSGTKTITTNSVVLPFSIIFNGSGGTFQLADNLTSSRNSTLLTRTNGTFDANGKTVTLTGGNNVIIAAGFTGSSAFYNLSRISSSPSKSDALIFSGDVTISNIFTIDMGATVTNRCYVQATTAGTAVTITSASNSFNNSDFQDITAAGAASWNLSAITGLSGDCGGNTGITFTTAATQTATGTASFAWSTHGWTSRVPLPQDDVIVNNAFIAGRTVTADMPRLGKSITFSCTGSPILNLSATQVLFGSLDLTGIGSFAVATPSLTFAGRGAYTLISAGLVFEKAIALEAPGGTLQLLDDLNVGSSTTRIFTFSAGTFDLNGKTFTHFGTVSNTSLTTRVLAFNGGIWDITNTGTVTVWNSSTGSNFSTTGTGTIKISGSTTNVRTFSGGGYTYPILWFTNTTPGGQLTITSSSTFGEFKCNDTNGQTIKFTAATTQTIGIWSVRGGVGGLITLDSTTTGIFTLTKTDAGNFYGDYLNIQHSVATSPKGGGWYAGENSIDNQAIVTAGSGWIFSGSSGALKNSFSKPIKPRLFRPGNAR